ncbi:hypothetical protein HDU77_008257 [Chytriomyces hyalinus]|nr:hypothetical protein HDU77_008257 [Chytriomyces hyalinus]
MGRFPFRATGAASYLSKYPVEACLSSKTRPSVNRSPEAEPKLGGNMNFRRALSSSPNAAPDLTSWSSSVVVTMQCYAIAKSLAIFKLCASPVFVRYGPVLLDAAEKVPGLKQAARFVVRKTFFEHFCGGENTQQVHATMTEYRERGIGVILNYAVEADVSTVTPTLQETVEEARRVCAGMKESADIASQHPHNFIAMKVTPLIPPSVLLRWTNSLRAVYAAFEQDAREIKGIKCLQKDAFMNPDGAFMKRFNKLAQNKKTAELLWSQMDYNNTGAVDLIDVSNVFTISNRDARGVLVTNAEKNEALALATESDFQVIDAVFPFIEEIVAHSKSKHVKVIVDAEWTYVQPAIDDMALNLGKKFNGKRMAANEGINGGRPVIFNTYQMYLKDALGRVHRELERAERGGYNVGIKIVRGAYIVSETERAASMGYENPICPTLEATHTSFNSAISLCIQKIHENTPAPSIETPLPVQFFSASHNFESVIHAWTLLKQYGIDFQSDCVGFGQLRGMQDGTTYGIAAHGLKGYKCVPYGPVEVTIPYLVRRAQENSAVLGGVKVDKENLWNEIKTRFGML